MQSLVPGCRAGNATQRPSRGCIAPPENEGVCSLRGATDKNIDHSHYTFLGVSKKKGGKKAYSSIRHNLQEDIKQLSDCLCLCGPAAGSYNPYPSPQRDAWFASHLCSTLLLFSPRLKISIILFLALIPTSFSYICLQVQNLHVWNKEISGRLRLTS